MAGYLFIFFTGEHEDGEQVYFAVSKDGMHWEDLNDGKPVLVSPLGELGVRDPFVVKDEANNKFYLIATDLRIGAGKGWGVAQHSGSRDLIVWESSDLVNWSEPWACTVGAEGAGCVWAPESIYDEERQEFFVFWASMVKLEGDVEAKQRIYGAYTKDFRDFSEPFIYEERANHVIDMNIVKDNGWYYRFIKDETTKNVTMDRVKTLDGDEVQRIDSPVLDNLFGVEGPEAYQLPDGRWCLIVDQFGSGKGYLPLITSKLGEVDFQVADRTEYDLGILKKRHGCVLKITEEEYKGVKKNYICNNRNR